MPIVWRLARPEFADELDGEGARLFGGRWNSRGQRALYTSRHLSLSVLEAYVNIPPELRDELPELRAVQISIPDDAGTLHVSRQQLDDLLAGPNARGACRDIGDRWIERNAELVLDVPSVLVPEESNLIVNPAHPRMPEVKILSARAFHFDPRLAASKP
jgi:RES domain-containing protein